jgi:hypothetical protein
MVDGLAKSVLKDVARNTYTKRVVVDTLGFSPTQRAAFMAKLQEGFKGGVAKDILLLAD